jgi:imidazolonepropionase-like amidohydrolase
MPAPAAAEPVPAVAAAPLEQATQLHWVVVSHGRKVGSYDVRNAPDGTTTAVYHVLENGRGPHVEATFRLGEDRALARFEAKGHHEMGTPIAEVMERTGNRSRWNSTEEAGERVVTGPAFYVPSADLPMQGELVRAAIAAGGQVAILPAGEARVEKVAEVEVAAAGEHRSLAGYRVTGLELTPSYQWLNPDGSWFGAAHPSWAVVPLGWEAAIEPLVAERRALERTRLTELARIHAHQPPAGGLAYVHARVLDVENGRWLEDRTVVVTGQTIAAIGPSKKLKVPRGAEVVDLTGKSLIPGLVDMHGHSSADDGVLHLASGVTTVRDVGSDPDDLDALKADWDRGTTVGPHLLRMGFIEGRNDKAASSKVTAETPDEARAAVAFFAERGYEGIKIYNSVKVELVPLLAAEAHARNIRVIGHIPVHMLANEAVRAGYDGIEHINMLFLNFLATHETDTRDTTRFTLVGEKGWTIDLDSRGVDEFIALLRSRGAVVDPTLSAFEDLWAGVPGAVTPGLEELVGRLPVLSARGFLTGGLPLEGDTHATYLRSWEHVLAMVKKLHDSGVTVVLGTDHIPGLILHHEAVLFARAGIENADILRQATLGSARAMGMDQTFGSIARGMRADLVVLDGDPLADIRALGRVVSTMKAGVVYPSPPLYRAAGVRPLVE